MVILVRCFLSACISSWEFNLSKNGLIFHQRNHCDFHQNHSDHYCNSQMFVAFLPGSSLEADRNGDMELLCHPPGHCFTWGSCFITCEMIVTRKGKAMNQIAVRRGGFLRESSCFLKVYLRCTLKMEFPSVEVFTWLPSLVHPALCCVVFWFWFFKKVSLAW